MQLNLYETFVKEVCRNCKNKSICDEELNIKIDGSIKCESYQKDSEGEDANDNRRSD